MSQPISRRKVLQLVGASAGIAALPCISKATATTAPKVNVLFTYCLNMATLRGHNLGFVKELETASKAGFRSVEIWMDSLQTYLDKGGSLADAKKLLDDLGITIENNIGFAQWIVDEEATRKKGVEQMKNEMDMLAQLGCKRTAAPPMGATGLPMLDLNIIAERYRTILDIGDSTGVMPQLEMWGFSKNLSRANEVLYVAMQTGHPSAKVLLDVFHLYKGGTPVETLHLMNPLAVDILHMNDYPANSVAANITDADRVYAGNGVAPIKLILKALQHNARPLVISTEVFNKKYYSQDALLVAKTALAKMKAVTSELE